MDPDEVRLMASEGCPPAFIDLALACCSTDRSKRPLMTDILTSLREIEADVITRSTEEPHVGSIKFLGSKGRPGAPQKRRIPSFGQSLKVGKAAATPPQINTHGLHETSDLSEDEEDEEIEAILALNGISLQEHGGGSDTGSWRLDGWMKEYHDAKLAAAEQGTDAHSSGVALTDEPSQLAPNRFVPFAILILAPQIIGTTRRARLEPHFWMIRTSPKAP